MHTNIWYLVVSLNYCSQNGGNLYRAPYYNRNLNIGPRIDSNLGQSPYEYLVFGPQGPAPTFTVARSTVAIASFY